MNSERVMEDESGDNEDDEVARVKRCESEEDLNLKWLTK